MRIIGKELTRLDMKNLHLEGIVIDPASLKELLAADPDEIVSLQGPNMTAVDALVFATQCLQNKAFPFISDDGDVKMIGNGMAKEIYYRLSKFGSADQPVIERALSARLARLKAQEALKDAVDEEAGALLALAA